MDKTLFAWYELQSHTFKVKSAFIHDIAPSHVSKLIHEFFEHKRFAEEKIMEWPSSSPELNPIENLCSIVKMKLYEGGKQYNSIADQWEAIKATMLKIDPAEIKEKITKSMNNRLLAIIEKSHYTEM